MPRRKTAFPDRNKKIWIGAAGVLMIGLLFLVSSFPHGHPRVQRSRPITTVRRAASQPWSERKERSTTSSARSAGPRRSLDGHGLGVRNTQPFPPAASRPLGGQIAIILDDWGYTMRQVPALQSIHQPLTVSILPALPHSADVANAAHQSGHEVMLHMPMEAVDPKAPRERRIILTGMPKDEVLQTMDQMIQTVPFVVGMNNHQGSKATADPQLMQIVLGEVKRRGLFFVDSVTGRSICAAAAKRQKVRFGERAVFLDNNDNPDEIRRQVMRLRALASSNGRAIAIGHDRPNTLKVLQQVLPELEKSGCRIVHASELTSVPD